MHPPRSIPELDAVGSVALDKKATDMDLYDLAKCASASSEAIFDQ